MTLYISSDHAGVELKQFLIDSLPDLPWKDLGPSTTDSVDYPDQADALIKYLSSAQDIGVLICGSGQGMAMRANKYPQIRAALCYNPETARLAREHNDANILCIGARFLKPEETVDILCTFLDTNFAGDRHQLRVNKLGKSVYENL